MRDRGGGAAVGHAELGQDAGHVHGDGPGADEQRLGNLAVGAALGDQRKHIPLALSEAELIARAMPRPGILSRRGLVWRRPGRG